MSITTGKVITEAQKKACRWRMNRIQDVVGRLLLPVMTLEMLTPEAGPPAADSTERMNGGEIGEVK